MRRAAGKGPGAERALEQIGDPQAVPLLIQALGDSDWLVRNAAAEALGRIGDPQAIPALMQALGDSEWGVREAAVEALGQIGTPQAIPALMQALGDSEKWMRAVAAKALGKLVDSVSDAEVTRHVAGALWRRLTDSERSEGGCVPGSWNR